MKNICRVRSAELALEVLERQKFTMILLDYRLEGMDGAEFVERVRARGDETPIIMVSGVPDKAGVLRAAHFQHVDFIGKPMQIIDLASAMQQLAEAA